MKRSLWFLTIFTIVIVVFYMMPVFFSPPVETPVSDDFQSPVGKVASLSYGKLSDTGFSMYINKSKSDLEKDFGEPIIMQETGFGFSIATYEDGVRKLFLEVNLKKDIVQSIKVSGKSTDKIVPFHFGMSLTELTDITTLYPNFSFDYEGETVDIELTEEDMNYRPLIAFENDTFAILFFGQTNNELYAVDYLNKEFLLSLMPYQLNSSSQYNFSYEEGLSEEDWDEIDQLNASRAKSLIVFLRNLEGYSNYHSSSIVKNEAESLMTQLIAEPETVLTDKSSTDWQGSLENALLSPSVLLTTDDLLYSDDFLKKKQTMLTAKPVVDLSYSILTWYSNPYIHSRFISDENQALEIAFFKENMLVLLQQEIEMKDSGNE